LFAFSSNQDTQKYYADSFVQKGIPVIKNSAMDIEIPSYTQPDPSQKNRDISHWVSLLPTQYQNEDAYFIFPKAGTVIPVVEMTDKERKTLNN
jgi:hypothetical protein